MIQLFDTHAHLDQPEFDDDRTEMIARARSAGVTTVIAVGTTAATSAACVALAAAQEGVFAALGIQPNYCAEAAADDWQRVLSLVDRPGVVAIGETGLDRHWDFAPLEVQRDYFDRHLRLSQERKLPFIVHTRESEEDVLAMLREARRRGPLAGVMHSFTGTTETAAECVELGLYISFAGMVTYKKSDPLRCVARRVPAERILIETDSPYLAPHPLRGSRNEPAHLVHTAACLAHERGQTLEEFAALTTANAWQLFRSETRDEG
ncbi:MAG TPA: TatD family hydrolase [Pirellulales bacterium]|nr:TatD family hydrolase [Pirellulales bacterium]